MTNGIRIFANGSQYADWQAYNCHRCKKFPWTLPDCDIDVALDEAYIGDGTVSQEIANRMAYNEKRNDYAWCCGEIDWTEEWIAERKRQIGEKNG